MIVIALGMHRSGTSALAGLLHSNGIVMGEEGDFYPPPMRENPRGFFENKQFRRLNDRVLRKGGYHVKSFDPILPNWDALNIDDCYIEQMVDLITYYTTRYEHWGWKDPRTCLTLCHWFKALSISKVDPSTIKIIVMLRKYDDIAQSMRNRGNKEKLYRGQFAALARLYHTKALYALINRNIPYTNIPFELLIFETNRAIDHINTYLGGNFIQNSSFIESNISRTRRAKIA